MCTASHATTRHFSWFPWRHGMFHWSDKQKNYINRLPRIVVELNSIHWIAKVSNGLNSIHCLHNCSHKSNLTKGKHCLTASTLIATHYDFNQILKTYKLYKLRSTTRMYNKWCCSKGFYLNDYTYRLHPKRE